MSQKRKEIIRAVNAAFERNDVEAFLAYCADNMEWTIVGEQPVKGKDAIRDWMGIGSREAPKITVDTMVAEGDFVAVTGDVTMVENGAAVPYAYCDVWRFSGDQLVELRAFMARMDKGGRKD